MKKVIQTLSTSLLCALMTSCNLLQPSQKPSEAPEGMRFLSQITGIWYGPVVSSTSAGNFTEWYADFRPVSESQVSQFSNLDSQTVNNISFFIVRHHGKMKIAMRTEGCFNKSCCITYEVMDSVNEKSGYYRFSDFCGGASRASTSFVFRGDSMIMEVKTNKFNKEEAPVLHSRWLAVHGDQNSAKDAMSKFKYPQTHVVRDFSHVFDHLTESIFFSTENDPYPSCEQPRTGSANIIIEVDQSINLPKPSEIFLLLCTESIFDGLKIRTDRHEYYSRYMKVSALKNRAIIDNIHPGSYFLYVFADTNGDGLHTRGEFMSSDPAHRIHIGRDSITNASVVLDMIIP